MRNRTPLLSAGLLFVATAVASGQAVWQNKLRHDLPYLGHRNWIVIADSAYPLQTAEGIETVYADADQLQVVRAVLDELANVKHVKPIIYTDAELQYVAEKNARGITVYREGLSRLLSERSVQVLPHDEIIGRLDEAGKTFKVLVIKTRLSLTYTSVFLQLDCGYWNPEAEKELRAAMKSGAAK